MGREVIVPSTFVLHCIVQLRKIDASSPPCDNHVNINLFLAQRICFMVIITSVPTSEMWLGSSQQNGFVAQQIWAHCTLGPAYEFGYYYEHSATTSNYFFRPQTKLRKDNVFTPVCQSFCSRGEVDTTPGRHPLSRHPPPPRDGHFSGRYAFYWNAVLFSVKNTSDCHQYWKSLVITSEFNYSL